MTGRPALGITHRPSKASGHQPCTLALLVVAIWSVVAPSSSPLKSHGPPTSLASVGGDADMKRPPGSASQAKGSPGGSKDLERLPLSHAGEKPAPPAPAPAPPPPPPEPTTEAEVQEDPPQEVSKEGLKNLCEAAYRDLAVRSGGNKQVLGAAVIGGACGSLFMIPGIPDLDLMGIKLRKWKAPLAGALAGLYFVQQPEDKPMGPVMREASQKLMEKWDGVAATWSR